MTTSSSDVRAAATVLAAERVVAQALRGVCAMAVPASLGEPGASWEHVTVRHGAIRSLAEARAVTDVAEIFTRACGGRSWAMSAGLERTCVFVGSAQVGEAVVEQLAAALRNHPGWTVTRQRD